MKFSQATLLALLATATFVTAAPGEPIVSSNVLVTRDQGDDLINLLKEIETLNINKRELSDENQIIELNKRQDSLIVQLVNALADSNLLPDVWKVISNDEDLKSELVSSTKAILKSALVEAPSLLSALFQSGILETILKDVLGDSQLRSVLLSVGKELFTDAFTILREYQNLTSSDTGSSGTTTSTTVALSSASIQPTQTNVLSISINTGTSSLKTREDGIYLEERDLSSILVSVVNLIKNSGILSTIIQKISANPEQAISFLTTVLKEGIVIGKDVYNWAKSSGLLQEAITWIGEHGGTFGSIVAKILGAGLSSGSVSQSDVNDAGSVTATTYTTTTAYVAGSANTLRKVRRAY